MPGDHTVTIEDQRASLASLAHGAKRPVKKLEEMTSVGVSWCGGVRPARGADGTSAAMY